MAAADGTATAITLASVAGDPGIDFQVNVADLVPAWTGTIRAGDKIEVMWTISFTWLGTTEAQPQIKGSPDRLYSSANDNANGAAAMGYLIGENTAWPSNPMPRLRIYSLDPDVQTPPLQEEPADADVVETSASANASGTGTVWQTSFTASDTKLESAAKFVIPWPDGTEPSPNYRFQWYRVDLGGLVLDAGYLGFLPARAAGTLGEQNFNVNINANPS